MKSKPSHTHQTVKLFNSKANFGIGGTRGSRVLWVRVYLCHSLGSSLAAAGKGKLFALPTSAASSQTYMPVALHCCFAPREHLETLETFYILTGESTGATGLYKELLSTVHLSTPPLPSKALSRPQCQQHHR